MGFIGTVSAVAMACAPPLAYGDQMVSIIRKRDSRGFSIDICGVLIVANVTRVFYWLGAFLSLPSLCCCYDDMLFCGVRD